MLESPCSLEELCLDTICDNILSYVEAIPNSPLKNKDDNWDDFEDRFDDEYKKIYRFKDHELFLINEISEKLLRKFIEKNIICDALLNIFTARNTKLKAVRIKNCKISIDGLKILKDHKISDLECVNIRPVGIIQIIGK